RVGSKGRIAVKGTVGLQPLAVQADVQAAGIDLVGFQSYAPPETNVIVTSGTLDVRGRVAYDSGPSGPNVRYVGDLAINGFGSLDQPGSQELMRWKSLAATGIDLATAPFHVAAGVVTLDHFYARLILDADAKLNVVQLLKPEPAADAPPAPGAATPAPAGDIPASIARVQLSNGEVEFSDFFIRPNYSVHLTDLDGRLDGLAASQAGTVQVTARVDGAAPVDIRGTVNPFAKPLKLDIDARATGADLSPLTPYAVKYAGYGIEKGKLSMEVHYTVEERKLSATNRITLDQLTFGDHVESPTATKLPVLLLVSLLKDRDGVIKLDLPIAGTLDDPQFSIWRIVLQILGNLLTKAATAPFALLGAMAGGGEQLAYVEFQPGLAVLTPASEQKLATLAKALADRPHVKLDATGRAIAEVDAEALRRASLDRALRHAKQKELARKGESAPPIEELVLEPAESAKYLKAVYADTQLAGKPRNLIGMQKEIPPEEMEKLLLASYTVGDDALHELANDRAEAVRDWFVSKGNVPVERVFIAAPKLGREGLKDEGAPTRVDFAIR
ncbi:MAG TPA: DUF748 domain-containing protein, partial [Usitatibacter sp.]|nr:DUF748 domain-containing protein [Usitatibacter sp.]